ncbi:related to Rtm1p [Cephalotrichum gorgonifer]|uniref:Related to Rtm1p n=1 Tax=Cephalotrichum gorgonifer TaxID=2041049 RepID=A0AAE8N5K6_9PEZI|nr:related to Rtm1p [Cephalotrichum gorgonifer]
MSGDYVPGSYYFYAPNHGAAIFFAIAFAVSGVIHLYQCVRYKSFKLTPLFPFCCLLFTAGYAVRVYGSYNYDNLDVYIASICLVYFAPPLLELQNYHVLGRILYYAPYHSPLHPGRVLTTFGFISAIVESLTGWGASYTANQSLPDSQRAIGHALIKTSLLLQVVVLVCFVILAGIFHRRCLRGGVTDMRLQRPLIVLYISACLIFARTIFRVVEYFGMTQMKYDDPAFDPSTITPLLRKEWYFYVFEGALMLINTYLFNAQHPRMFLPEKSSTYLALDGKTEVDGPGWKEDRPWVMTFIDPFNFQGMITGGAKMKMDPFWETDGIGGPRKSGATESV